MHGRVGGLELIPTCCIERAWTVALGLGSLWLGRLSQAVSYVLYYIAERRKARQAGFQEQSEAQLDVMSIVWGYCALLRAIRSGERDELDRTMESSLSRSRS